MTEDEEGKDILTQRYIMDLKKSDVDCFMRAKIIKNYLKNHNLSGRAFATKFNIPKSTVEDWLLFDKLKKEDYTKMKDSGLNQTEIYRTLRNRKKEVIKDIVQETKFEYDLKTCIGLLRPHINIAKLSANVSSLITDLQDIINRIKMRLDKQK